MVNFTRLITGRSEFRDFLGSTLLTECNGRAEALITMLMRNLLVLVFTEFPAQTMFVGTT
jgi:hypothetical protein